MVECLAKVMSEQEYAALFDLVDVRFAVLPDHPLKAIWRRRDPTTGNVTVLTSSAFLDAVEACSPGGWEACPDYLDQPWALGIGNAESAGVFGITPSINAA